MDSMAEKERDRVSFKTQGGDTPRSDEIEIAGSREERERERERSPFLGGYDGTAHDKARYRSSRVRGGRSRFAS